MLLRSATSAGVSDEQLAAHVESAAQRSEDDRSGQAYVDRAVTLYHRDWWRLANEREMMRLARTEFFQEYDLFLCPTSSSAAFPHDQEGDRFDRTLPINGGRRLGADQLFWAGLSGGVHLPSTVAPAGLTKSGLPCGLQIVGDFLQDRTCIEFARLMSQELGGFVPPPGYE